MTVINKDKKINITKQSKDNFIFRYAIVIEYNGSKFCGSQKQLSQRTVQSELEKALVILLKYDITTIFSGRTDRGVNSKGQVAHFDLPIKINEDNFLYSINAILPDDISVSTIKEVDKKFHSQKSALFKWYRYKIFNGKQRSVWMANSLHINKELDLNEMNKALKLLEGKHDFNSFKTTNSKNPYTVCVMYSAKCSKENELIYVDLVANRFLYNMVRIIVGTILDIGKGMHEAEHILEVLNSKNRVNAGKTVRPEGLTFMFVGYNEYNICDKLNKEAIYNENLLCQAS